MSIALVITGKAGAAAFTEVIGQHMDAMKKYSRIRERHPQSVCGRGARAERAVFGTPGISRPFIPHDAVQSAAGHQRCNLLKLNLL